MNAMKEHMNWNWLSQYQIVWKLFKVINLNFLNDIFHKKVMLKISIQVVRRDVLINTRFYNLKLLTKGNIMWTFTFRYRLSNIYIIQAGNLSLLYVFR